MGHPQHPAGPVRGALPHALWSRWVLAPVRPSAAQESLARLQCVWVSAALAEFRQCCSVTRTSSCVVSVGCWPMSALCPPQATSPACRYKSTLFPPWSRPSTGSGNQGGMSAENRPQRSQWLRLQLSFHLCLLTFIPPPASHPLLCFPLLLCSVCHCGCGEDEVWLRLPSPETCAGEVPSPVFSGCLLPSQSVMVISPGIVWQGLYLGITSNQGQLSASEP